VSQSLSRERGREPVLELREPVLDS